MASCAPKNKKTWGSLAVQSVKMSSLTVFHHEFPEVNRMRQSQVWSAHRWWERCLNKCACWPNLFFFFSSLTKKSVCISCHTMKFNKKSNNQVHNITSLYSDMLTRCIFFFSNLVLISLSHTCRDVCCTTFHWLIKRHRYQVFPEGLPWICCIRTHTSFFSFPSMTSFSSQLHLALSFVCHPPNHPIHRFA